MPDLVHAWVRVRFLGQWTWVAYLYPNLYVVQTLPTLLASLRSVWGPDNVDYVTNPPLPFKV
jgi:hypothetical protein